MSDSFDLFEDPFVSWLDLEGKASRVGVRELLKRAGELRSFGNETPQTTFAVLRLLLVLLQKTRPLGIDDEWQRLWSDSRFPDEWLTEIEKAARGKFDLLDPKRPFMQSALIADETRPVSDLIAEFPTDTNINHSRHIYDARVGLCPACGACGLLRLAPFCGQGGQGKAPSINAPPPAYFVPTGSTLFHTLLLNARSLVAVKGDQPVWDGKSSGPQIGPLEGFTWESRSVRLLPEDAPDNLCSLCGTREIRDPPRLVRRIVFRKGRDRADGRLKDWRDPHVAYVEEAGGKASKRVRTVLAPEPVQNASAAVGFWRVLAGTLLRSGHENMEDFTCAAVACARQIRPNDHTTVSVVLTHTRQAKVLHDQIDRWVIPPLNEARDRALLAELEEWFGHGIAHLGELPLTEFERRAERHFRALLARSGADVNDWRRAVREDAKNLSRPVSRPDRAIEAARTRATIKHAVETAFPDQEKAP